MSMLCLHYRCTYLVDVRCKFRVRYVCVSCTLFGLKSLQCMRIKLHFHEKNSEPAMFHAHRSSVGRSSWCTVFMLMLMPDALSNLSVALCGLPFAVVPKNFHFCNDITHRNFTNSLVVMVTHYRTHSNSLSSLEKRVFHKYL